MNPAKTMAIVKPVTFHDAATAAADGTTFEVGAYKTLKVEIVTAGGNSARLINFTGFGPSGTARLIPGVLVSDSTAFTVALSTTSTGEFWDFDITGLSSVLMDLVSMTAGSVTVKGIAAE